MSALKQKLIHEIKILCTYTLMLFVMFSIFDIYERLLLNDYSSTTLHYGYSLIEALILAKVIMIGEAVHLGEKFKNRPLIIPVIYKTIMFSLLLFLFNFIEHYLEGYFSGNTIQQTFDEVMQQRINIILAKNFIMIIIIAQFFILQQLSDVLGEGRLWNLFFKQRNSN